MDNIVRIDAYDHIIGVLVCIIDSLAFIYISLTLLCHLHHRQASARSQIIDKLVRIIGKHVQCSFSHHRQTSSHHRQGPALSRVINTLTLAYRSARSALIFSSHSALDQIIDAVVCIIDKPTFIYIIDAVVSFASSASSFSARYCIIDKLVRIIDKLALFLAL